MLLKPPIPSYASGFAKAQRLEEELGKILLRGALELVDHLGLDLLQPAAVSSAEGVP